MIPTPTLKLPQLSPLKKTKGKLGKYLWIELGDVRFSISPVASELTLEISPKIGEVTEAKKYSFQKDSSFFMLDLFMFFASC